MLFGPHEIFLRTFFYLDLHMSSLTVNNLTAQFTTVIRSGITLQQQIKPVFSGISCSADHQSNLFIIGETGSGKTTLLKTIAGIVQSVSGDIIVNNESVTNKKVSFRSTLIQYVSQSNQESFNPVLSVKKSLKNSVKPSVFHSPIVQKSDMAPFEKMFNLNPDLSEKKPSELSGGQMQRFGIIRALLAKPQILLLDEPTSALEEELKISVTQNVIDYCKSHGITLIAVSHDMKIVKTFANQVLIIKDGIQQEFSAVSNSDFMPSCDYGKQLWSQNFLL